MSLDRTAPEELFAQLADILMGQIASGELPPRTKLPPQLELVERYQVSRGTVARATEVLMEAGLVRFVKGKGLYLGEPEVIERWRKDRAKRRKS